MVCKNSPILVWFANIKPVTAAAVVVAAGVGVLWVDDGEEVEEEALVVGGMDSWSCCGDAPVQTVATWNDAGPHGIKVM